MFSNIKHIFFDLDDTLWDFEKNSSQVLTALFSEFDLGTKLKTDFETFHYTYKEVNNSLWRSFNKKEIDKPFLRNNRFDIVFKKFLYHNYEENLKVTELYLERSPYGTHLKKDCIEVLDYLQPNYSLHLITNGFKEVQHIKIENCGLKPYFSQILISEEHQLLKPDEKIFRLAETLANCSREECLMIGDNFESDVEGALNAGWKSIFLTQEKSNHKVYTIDHLLALKQIL
ncbi:MAG: noncanonical pyrimidine nucleotidase, YjjG family [Bacteroidetes bacterium]|nr:noncanonical pyrimidine nucleotidase, YjjG family [Bacteroidota bacterium]